ncbi:glycosyltransferase family 2 protein [Terrabacter sp. MAHUQ-38]|nr:glycosyltransferase family 2 protein [Terrabacter sp. MAHUQ-38]
MTPQIGAVRAPAGQKVLIVVPAYNEEAALPGVLREIHSALPDCDVLVIDDGSTDRTAKVAATHAVVARLPFNVGVGGAMRTGFRYAMERGYGVVIQIDADGQHDPWQAAALIAGLAEADVVVGTRFSTSDVAWIPGHRRAAMTVLARTVSGIVRTRVTDSTSGFRAHSSRAIRLFAQHYPTEYLGDTVESLVIAHRAGLRIAEAPVSMRERTLGTASQGTASSVRYVARVLASTYLARIRSWPISGEAAA